jgi:hypothetical protein
MDLVGSCRREEIPLKRRVRLLERSQNLRLRIERGFMLAPGVVLALPAELRSADSRGGCPHMNLGGCRYIKACPHTNMYY